MKHVNMVAMIVGYVTIAALVLAAVTGNITITYPKDDPGHAVVGIFS